MDKDTQYSLTVISVDICEEVIKRKSLETAPIKRFEGMERRVSE